MAIGTKYQNNIKVYHLVRPSPLAATSTLHPRGGVDAAVFQGRTLDLCGGLECWDYGAGILVELISQQSNNAEAVL